jgi:hypothetical protein
MWHRKTWLWCCHWDQCLSPVAVAVIGIARNRVRPFAMPVGFRFEVAVIEIGVIDSYLST